MSESNLLKLPHDELAHHAQQGWERASHWLEKYHEALGDRRRFKEVLDRVRKMIQETPGGVEDTNAHLWGILKRIRKELGE